MNLIEQLKYDLDKNDLIVIFDTRTESVKSFYQLFCQKGIHRITNEHDGKSEQEGKRAPAILVITCDEEAGKSVDGISEVRLISDDRMEALLLTYYLYEFTDRIIVLSERTQFSGLMNYYTGGLLTYEQMVDAVFYGYITS
ncbi:hypothetical protein ACTQ1O_13350 [Bilifractor sp. LCP21S3_A7]|uniref:hypothetical protein n=1 Tax=Bilifractor sp. LCP21S3_A7 TaxID=3438738 RepID=UPI003F8E2250